MLLPMVACSELGSSRNSCVWEGLQMSCQHLHHADWQRRRSRCGGAGCSSLCCGLFLKDPRAALLVVRVEEGGWGVVLPCRRKLLRYRSYLGVETGFSV